MPWQVGSEGRAALLDWLFAADLATDVSVAKLRSLTGRRLHGEPIPAGRESGMHRLRRAVGRKRFIEFYHEVRVALAMATTLHAAYVKDPETPLVRFGVQFTTLQMYLDDVRLDVERERGRPVRPYRPSHRSLSLAGELALATYERMLGARSVSVCRYCQRPQLWSDTRPRVTCGRDECQAAYRREWKQQHPEDPEQVARRVRRHRQKRGVQR